MSKNLSAKYCQTSYKKSLWKISNSSKEENEKKDQQYGHVSYKTLS